MITGFALQEVIRSSFCVILNFMYIKTYEKRPTINIQKFELTCEDSVKLLGIEIDYQLNFDTHISTICRKASQQLSIIKRLGPYLNRLNKLTIFHTFILSNFNFCPLAWHFPYNLL
jgi:hypothetical protein